MVCFSWITDFICQGQIHHLVLEFLLIVWVIWLITRKSKKEEIKLTENEVETLVKDYEPEPLVTEVPSTHYALKPRIVRGKAGKFVNVDGIECLNFATMNFLGFIGNEDIEASAISTIERYGVGSCGPRGFLGTTELHLALEKQIAEFMGAEDAVVYSYGFSTISSAIPAYAKKGDIIFVDECANFAIQKGLDASRSVIKYFQHNDLIDLERILREQAFIDFQNPKKAGRSRRFLIVEGIYANTGEICQLPSIVKLRKKYKLRLFIDESISFGVLGQNGRGITEYFEIPISEVDLIMASLENAIGSIGGFCVGTTFIVDHQRLSGLGYCFSASLAPLLVVSAMEALKKMEREPELLSRLNRLCKEMHFNLMTSSIIGERLQLVGDEDSPIHLLVLREDEYCFNRHTVISDIIEACIQDGKAICRASFIEEDRSTMPDSIRITTSAFLTEENIHALVQTLEIACWNRFHPNAEPS